MKEQKIFQILLTFGTILCMMNVFFYFDKERAKEPTYLPNAGLLVQNTYMGPTQPIPGNPHLIRIEVLVKDSPKLAGLQVQSVSFDGQSIPLKPRDIFGKRASASFQLPPGKYTLRWTVQRDKIVWPRDITREEELTIDPRDLWIQVLIEGDQASIR